MGKYHSTTIALVLLAGCTDTANYTVGKHVFALTEPYVHVPRFYAFWADKPTSLSFTLNPQAPADAQHVVNVETTTDTCLPSRLAGPSPLASACAAARARSAVGMGGRLTKSGNRSQWSYQAGGRTVATCYDTPKGGGLCTAVSNYQDVLISIGFRDKEAGDLPAMEAEARRLLKGWDGAK